MMITAWNRFKLNARFLLGLHFDTFSVDLLTNIDDPDQKYKDRSPI